MGDLLQGKRGLVMGVANDHSIAWGIAKTLAAHGAEMAFTYQGDALAKRVKPLAESVKSQIVVPCDVTDEASLDATFKAIQDQWGKLDFLVHAIAFSDKNELDGKYLNTSRSNFARTMDISCYSFTACCQRAVPLMTDGGSLLTLSYYGAERVMPHYNVMGVAKAALESAVRYLANDLGPEGIRVNAISPGPMKTLAGAAIGGARKTYRHTEANAPLRANATLEAIGGTITLNYGAMNASAAILVVSVIIFLCGLPIAYHAAKSGIDIDLLTRGAGFGYIGSTITSLIYASFTFIFFGIEAVILADMLDSFFGVPLWLGYLLSSVLIIPLANPYRTPR